MALMRWDPLKEMMSLQDEVTRMLRQGFFGEAPAVEEAEKTWSPAINMYETDYALIVEAELPGLNAEDVHTSVEDDVLHIEGERGFSKELKEEHLLRVERAHGPFERYIPLPFKVDAAKVDATVRDGVLEVTMPLAKEAKPRRIPIKVA